MPKNKEELLKFQEAFRIEQARKDSIRAVQPIVLPGDTLDGQPPYEGSIAFAELPKISGIGEGSLIDLFGKSIMYSSQAEEKRSQVAIKAGKVAARALQPLVEPVVEGVKTLTGDMLTGDYQRSVVANVAGAPVDIANALLSVLGIEATYSDKPFMGSKHIKESLDYLSGDPYSTKFMPK